MIVLTLAGDSGRRGGRGATGSGVAGGRSSFEPYTHGLVPDSTGLALLVAVTGGWFYNLETLRAVVEDGRRSRSGVVNAGDEKAGPEEKIAIGVGPAAAAVGTTGAEGDGPSPALCQVCGVA